MTSHANITLHDAATIAVTFAYDQRRKDAVSALTGATWSKEAKTWLVPIARFADVVALFDGVTVGEDVQPARMEQARRLFRQYTTSGVRFRLEGGQVRCDHALLDQWFSAHGTSLHTAALTDVLGERQPTIAPAELVPTVVEADLAKWHVGVLNAAIAAEKKAALIARRKRGLICRT